MSRVSKPEHAAQSRVIHLFVNELDYAYPGDWEERRHSSNTIKEDLKEMHISLPGIPRPADTDSVVIKMFMLTILRPAGQATGQAAGQATGQANRTNKIQLGNRLGDRLGNISVETSVKTSVEILNLLAENPRTTLAQIASKVGRTPRAIEMAVAKLQKEGRLRRVGPKKGGHWEVLV